MKAWKKIVALFALLSLLAFGFKPTPPAPEPEAVIDVANGPTANIYLLNMKSISQVICGNMTGTVEVVGQGRMVTAFHVVADERGSPKTNCMVKGRPAKVISYDSKLDFAILNGDTYKSDYYLYDCNGFTQGQLYIAVGYPGGRFVANLLVAGSIASETMETKTKQTFHGMRMLQGAVYPGMSGGPIVDLSGRVVGIVNATNLNHTTAYARELRDTELCSKD